MKKINTLLAFGILFLFACAQKNASNTAAVNEIKSIAVTEFSEKLNATKDKTLLDVRTAGEVASGVIEGAMNIDYNSDNFEAEVEKLDKENPVFIYCKSGGRSGSAMEILKQKGFKTVYNLDGGIMAWTSANLPLKSNAVEEKVNEEWTADAYSKLITDNKIVLVDFYAQWCAPCKRMKPALEELEKTYLGKAKIVRLDVDKSPELTKNEKVAALPTIKVYREGKLVKTITKELTKTELEQLIK